MGEAKAKAAIEAKAQAEALEKMLEIAVSEDDILIGAACIAVLGDFWPKDIAGVSAEDQLGQYWAYMRRALRREAVPVVWNRIRCLTEAMAHDHDLLVLLKGEETGEGIRFDLQNRTFRRVCATMPISLNREGANSVTSNVFVPYDVLRSLCAGPT